MGCEYCQKEAQTTFMGHCHRCLALALHYWRSTAAAWDGERTELKESISSLRKQLTAAELDKCYCKSDVDDVLTRAEVLLSDIREVVKGCK